MGYNFLRFIRLILWIFTPIWTEDGKNMEAKMTQFSCDSCGARLHIDAFAERTSCEYCGKENIIAPENRPALRPEVPQPAEVRIESDSQAMTIIQRWFSLKYIPMAFFAIAWDAFLIFWYGTVLSTGNVPWIAIVFPIAHVAVGIGITYSTIAGFVNRTILKVTSENITLWFEPLPWLGNKQIRIAEIRQLYCKEKIISTKNGSGTQYELFVVTKANQQEKLLGGLDNPDIGVFFEQQLERWLKIEDRPVIGEIRR
jgi:hypothetical protein